MYVCNMCTYISSGIDNSVVIAVDISVIHSVISSVWLTLFEMICMLTYISLSKLKPVHLYYIY